MIKAGDNEVLITVRKDLTDKIAIENKSEGVAIDPEEVRRARIKIGKESVEVEDYEVTVK